MDLAAAYRRSAYPAMGISYEVAATEPALRATLELADWMRRQEMRQIAKRAERTAAGRYLERTNSKGSES